jgi:hypothetical protein
MGLNFWEVTVILNPAREKDKIVRFEVFMAMDRYTTVSQEPALSIFSAGEDRGSRFLPTKPIGGTPQKNAIVIITGLGTSISHHSDYGCLWYGTLLVKQYQHLPLSGQKLQ